MKIQASSFCLTFFFFQLINPNKDETQFTISTAKTMLEMQIKAVCNDKKDDEPTVLPLHLMLVSGRPEGKKRRQEMIANPKLFESLKNASYKKCSMIGLVAMSPFLDNDEKRSMLESCRKLKIPSTEKDKMFESYFLYKSPEILTLLLCFNHNKDLPDLPKDLWPALLDHLKIRNKFKVLQARR